MDIASIIRNSVSASSSAASSQSIFDRICDNIRIHYERSASSFQELSRRSTKSKGDMFEDLALLVLKSQFTHIWKLKDLPSNIRTHLNLPKRDMGIDLIGAMIIDEKEDKNENEEEEKKKENELNPNNYTYASIQVKYRKRTANSVKNIQTQSNISSSASSASFEMGKIVKIYPNIISWKDIATFVALSPLEKFAKRYVITNANSVRWVGKNKKTDIVFAYRKFEKMTSISWLQLISNTNDQIETPPPQPPSEVDINSLREARLRHFCK